MSLPFAIPDALRRPPTHAQAAWIVTACTLVAMGAQVCLKLAAISLAAQAPASGIAGAVIQQLINPWAFAGFALYGLFTVGFIFALRGGDLSALYPIIALNYAWVAIASYFLFAERLNWGQGAGIALIIAGIGVMGHKRA